MASVLTLFVFFYLNLDIVKSARFEFHQDVKVGSYVIVEFHHFLALS